MITKFNEKELRNNSFLLNEFYRDSRGLDIIQWYEQRKVIKCNPKAKLKAFLIREEHTMNSYIKYIIQTILDDEEIMSKAKLVYDGSYCNICMKLLDNDNSWLNLDYDVIHNNITYDTFGKEPSFYNNLEFIKESGFETFYIQISNNWKTTLTTNQLYQICDTMSKNGISIDRIESMISLSLDMSEGSIIIRDGRLYIDVYYSIHQRCISQPLIDKLIHKFDIRFTNNANLLDWLDK